MDVSLNIYELSKLQRSLPWNILERMSIPEFQARLLTNYRMQRYLYISSCVEMNVALRSEQHLVFSRNIHSRHAFWWKGQAVMDALSINKIHIKFGSVNRIQCIICVQHSYLGFSRRAYIYAMPCHASKTKLRLAIRFSLPNSWKLRNSARNLQHANVEFFTLPQLYRHHYSAARQRRQLEGVIRSSQQTLDRQKWLPFSTTSSRSSSSSSSRPLPTRPPSP